MSEWKHDLITHEFPRDDVEGRESRRRKAAEVLARNVAKEPAALRALTESFSSYMDYDTEDVIRTTLVSLGESAAEPTATMLGERGCGKLAAEVLWALGPPGIRRLVDALGDVDSVRAAFALEALRRAGREASPYLLECMRTGRPAARRAAAERLAEADDGSTLIKALADPSCHDLAFEMLASMRGMARRYLEAATKDPETRADAEALLARLPAEKK